MCSFPADSGSLQVNENEWEEQAIRDVPHIAPKLSVSLSQIIRVLPRAESYSYVHIGIALYIAEPSRPSSSDDEAMILVQQSNLRVQISSHHVFNPHSSFLLVTNSETTRDRVRAMQSFINNDLKMQMDEWNFSLYGGFRYQAEESEGSPISVMTVYQGRTIIFLGNSFGFSRRTDCKIMDFCNPHNFVETNFNNTPCLFHGSSDHSGFEELAEKLVFPVTRTVANLADKVPSSNLFTSEPAMIECIEQNKLVSAPKAQTNILPVRGRWYRFGRAICNSEAKKLARHLRQRLPQERFLVAAIEAHAGGEADTIMKQGAQLPQRYNGKLAILHGMSHDKVIIATKEQDLVRSQENSGYLPSRNTLHPNDLAFSLGPAERLLVVSSLPLSRRIDILWTQYLSSANIYDDRFSVRALESIFISVLADMNREIRTFLHDSKLPNKIESPQRRLDIRNFLRIHLPILAELVQHQQASIDAKTPEYVVELLEYVEASCLPHRKRHIAHAILVPLFQRRRLLRKLIKSVINDLLKRNTHNERGLADFHSRAEARHSYFRSNPRDTSKGIHTRRSENAKMSEHVHTHSFTTASGLVPHTKHCTAHEWDTRRQRIEDSGARMEKEMENARKELSRMILDSSVP